MIMCSKNKVHKYRIACVSVFSCWYHFPFSHFSSLNASYYAHGEMSVYILKVFCRFFIFVSYVASASDNWICGK